MKKLTNLARIISILMVVMLLVGCTSKVETTEKAVNLEYYNPIPLFFEIDAEAGKDSFAKLSSETSGEQKEMVLQVFQELCEEYHINKENPEVKTLTAESMSEINGSTSWMPTGVYGGEKTIYLREGFSRKDISVGCHELCHYLSGDGVKYFIGEKYVTGSALNEGFTNYFSTRLYPHPKMQSVYEFETFVASQFVAIVGEEVAEKMYFHGAISELRDDFNNSLKDIYPDEEVEDVISTPFDTLCGTMQAYSYSMSMVDENQEFVDYAMMCVDCIEEMILNYAEQKGEKTECQKMLGEFLMAEQAITWTQFSNLGMMV